MQQLTEALAPWHEFYTLLGQASATMTGLLFVAASIGSGIFTQNRRAPLRMFLSASVVQFACVLAGCLVVLAPLQRWEILGGMVMAFGFSGLTFAAFAWRDMVHDGLDAKIDLEDRVWYAVAPAVGYLFETAAGLALILRSNFGFIGLAVALVALLLVAIHNAWDITVWSITRRKE